LQNLLAETRPGLIKTVPEPEAGMAVNWQGRERLQSRPWDVVLLTQEGPRPATFWPARTTSGG